jgi:hypothetical protein
MAKRQQEREDAFEEMATENDKDKKEARSNDRLQLKGTPVGLHRE